DHPPSPRAVADVRAARAAGSPTEVAKAVGVSQPTVSQYRRGVVVPTPVTLAAMAELAEGELVVEFRANRKRSRRRQSK
ncbi:MAG: helix-turn-helix transcriptional regulator, partial [Planctomycetota bacterium]